MEFFGLIEFPLWIILLLACLVSLYIYGSYPMNTWRDLGVPGPKPLPFIGNTHQYYDPKFGIRGGIHRLKKEYGKIFGLHFFRTPTLVVLDLDALKEVFVKDFNTYSDRFHIGGGSFIQMCVMKSLFFVNGMDWRRHRKIVSPTFTSGKLKLLTHYVNLTARQLSHKLVEHAQEDTQPLAKSVFGAFSLDVIGGTAFGLNLDTQNNPDGPFIRNASNLFQLKPLLKSAMAVTSIFPFMGFILQKLNITIIDDESVQFYKRQVTKLVLERKTDPDRFEHADFLQLLLKAEMDKSDDVVGEKKLTTEEVISSGILFLMAGYETTSNAMQFISYSLAKNHEVQNRVLEEIQTVVGDDEEDVTYEMCQSLKYTEAVIYETLRMYPPISSMNRKALKTTTLKGYTVPADTVIHIHIFNIGRDPEVYEDPDTFNPDRFYSCANITGSGGEEKTATVPSPVNSIGFVPFGFGPRQCVGMRLAMMEIKIALVHLLREVVLVDASPDDLQLDDYTGMLSAREPIQLQLAKR